MSNISGYYGDTGDKVENISESTYVQISLLGKHALSKKVYALISTESLPLIINHKWYLGKSGYPVTYTCLNKTVQSMHQLLFQDIDTKGKVIDHINRDKLDNRLSNLRMCTPTENSYNRSRSSINNKYKGVRQTGKNSWSAEITKDGIKYRLTGLKTEKEAALTYDILAEQFFGNFAGKNFT